VCVCVWGGHKSSLNKERSLEVLLVFLGRLWRF